MSQSSNERGVPFDEKICSMPGHLLLNNEEPIFSLWKDETHLISDPIKIRIYHMLGECHQA